MNVNTGEILSMKEALARDDKDAFLPLTRDEYERIMRSRMGLEERVEFLARQRPQAVQEAQAKSKGSSFCPSVKRHFKVRK